MAFVFPTSWYWLVGDASPSTSAWSTTDVAYVTKASDAGYLAFVAAGNSASVVDTTTNLVQLLCDAGYPDLAPVGGADVRFNDLTGPIRTRLVDFHRGGHARFTGGVSIVEDAISNKVAISSRHHTAAAAFAHAFFSYSGVSFPKISTVTVTIASPGVFTWSNHGLQINDALKLYTTGALPTGLGATLTYFVVSVPTSSTFTVSATLGGAAINTSGSQSGTHTAALIGGSLVGPSVNGVLSVERLRWNNGIQVFNESSNVAVAPTDGDKGYGTINVQTGYYVNGVAVPTTASKLSAFAATTSAELAGVISDETGSGALVFANTPTLVTPVLGTPGSGTLTNCTGLPVSTGISGLGTGVATLLATPSSANLAAAVTDETGSGALVFANTPTLVTPVLGTPGSGTLTNCTGLPISTGVSGLGAGVATFLATPSSANLASAVTGETGSGALVFGTAPTISAPVLTGTVDLSSVSSGQVKFPGTQNASSDVNTLDDYEEGTFTPALKFGGASTGMTFSTQYGAYTKIGNRVFINIHLQLTAKGSSTGAATITGLPVTASGDFSTFSWRINNSSAAGPLMINVASGATALTLEYFSGGNAGALDDTHFGAVTTLYISGGYQVAT